MNNTFFKSFLFILIVGLNFFIESSEGLEKFILFTSLYHEKNEIRCNEYKKCLLKNIEHPLIEKIVVFFDIVGQGTSNNFLQFLQNSSAEIEYIQGRPTFKGLFEYANKYYSGRKIIIANADIYFNETLKSIEFLDFNEMFIALTRWDEAKNGNLYKFNNEHSQDVWIFKTPFIVDKLTPIELGTWECDAKISKFLYEAGYKIINPSQEVQACHVHTSFIRNYTIPLSRMDLRVIYDVRIPFGSVNSFFQEPCSFRSANVRAPRITLLVSILPDHTICDISDFLRSLSKTANFHQLEVLMFKNNSLQLQDSDILACISMYPNVIYIPLEQDCSQGKILNMGINASLSDYLIRGTASNRYGLYFFELLARQLDMHKNIDIVSSGVFAVNENGKDFYDKYSDSNSARLDLEFPNNYGLFAIMWRKSMHAQYGYFNESNLNTPDYEYWRNCVDQKVTFLKTQEVLISDIIQIDQVSQDNFNQVTRKRRIRMR